MTNKVKKTRKGSLLSLSEPNFVSLVGSPANRAGFKVFRGDNAAALRASLDKQLEKVLQRKDINPDFSVYAIMLPEDVASRDEAELIQRTFGFDTDFTLTEDGGRYVLVANEPPAGEESITVELGDGFEARLVRSDNEKEITMAGISLVALRFDADKFINPEAISRWIAENEINCKVDPVDHDTYLEVQVAEVARSDGKIGVAAVEEGVAAVVTPSGEFHLPGKTSVVRNFVYGNYGWGATDFDVAIADQTFTPWLENAIFTLRHVLEEVAFYGPAEQRTADALTANISRVCLQFASAVSNMASTLPRSAKAEDTQVKNEDQKMPNAESQTPDNTTAAAAPVTGTPEPRSDEQTAAGAAGDEGAGTPDEDTTTTEVAPEGEVAPVEPPAETVAETVATTADQKLVEMFGTFSASLQELTASVKALRVDQTTLKADMDTVKQSVEDLGQSTIVRGDMGDPSPTKRSDNGDNKDSVFEGVIFRR